ncbi:hypothetical protein LG634_09725 [Streptomyces bambusae]|uniref:hypothetical protein n=1 Tax=Streptomyces bambusae TaxID=1550616 RepID=UPI001CFD9F98|nr:hypothetical protein [Streptomyces bambusae]MCB5165106.1 hypothetical protein [Streptomyces bambusae]
MDDVLSFSVTETTSDLAEAHALRLLRYEPRFPDDEFWWLDRDRDALGKVFLLRKGDRAAATLRIVPVTSCTTEIEELGLLPAGLAQDPNVWELGRLAGLPGSSAGGLPNSLLLFGWSAAWALERLPLTHVVSYCRGGKLRNFQAAGAEVVAGPHDIPGRGSDYYTIVADIAKVVDTVRGYGFGHLTDAAAAGRSEFTVADVLQPVPSPA